jgi:hypothetical protein
MTQEEAIVVASSARLRFNVPPGLQPVPAEKWIIELVPGTGPADTEIKAGPTLDRVAWLVKFADGPWWVELAVDDETSEILRVRRGR